MSVVFTWSESEMPALLASCNRDESRAIIERNFLPGTHLLEAGCGTGRWVRYFHDHGYKITGIEINPDAVASVKKVWPDLDVLVGDCEKSPFPENHFDGVLSFGVVEHWAEGPQKPLHDIYRVLKPGGKAFISVPCRSTVRRIKRALWLNEIFKAPRAFAVKLLKGRPATLQRFKKANLYPVNPPWGNFFEYIMTPAEFRREIEKAGFTIVEHVPLAHIDGVFHEINPFHLFVQVKDWDFQTTAIGRWLNRWLSRHPFAHPHMQAIIAQKPMS